MKPSAEQMMEAAQAALRDLVAPAVTDQWAASALRSVDVILSHLQARTACEGPMLFEDNRDLATLLAAAPATLAAASDIDAYLGETETLLSDYPTVAALSVLNIRGRAIVDDLLILCHRRKTEPEIESFHAMVRDYLTRHLARETPFFFPTFVGRPV